MTKRILLALALLIPQLAHADRSFYSSYNLVPGATGSTLTLSDFLTFSTTATGLKMNTSDAADSKKLVLAGGGAAAITRGSYFELYGNEEAGDGAMNFYGGGDTGSNINFALGNASATTRFLNASTALMWSINNSGTLTSDATNGGSLILAKTGANVNPIYNGLTSMDADLSASTSTHPGLVINQNRTISDSIVLAANAVDTLAGIITFSKTRATAPATDANTIVASGDEVGVFRFLAADGASYRNAAQISVEVDGTPGASDMPGRIEFQTTNDGSASPTLKWTIGNAGTLTSDATNGGGLVFAKSGSTISVQENSASTACLGVTTPNGTTPVAVTTSCAASGARVIYSRNGAVTNVGTVTTTTAPSGSGFSFASTNASDTTTSVVWFIIKESA